MDEYSYRDDASNDRAGSNSYFPPPELASSESRRLPECPLSFHGFAIELSTLESSSTATTNAISLALARSVLDGGINVSCSRDACVDITASATQPRDDLVGLWSRIYCPQLYSVARGSRSDVPEGIAIRHNAVASSWI